MKYPHTSWTLALLNLKGFTRRCGFLHRQNNEDKAKGIANLQENLMRYLIRISSTKLISKFLLVLFFVLGGLERINCKQWDPEMPFHLFKQSLMPSLMSLPNSLILPFLCPTAALACCSRLHSPHIHFIAQHVLGWGKLTLTRTTRWGSRLLIMHH